MTFLGWRVDAGQLGDCCADDTLWYLEKQDSQAGHYKYTVQGYRGTLHALSMTVVAHHLYTDKHFAHTGLRFGPH